MKFENQKFSNCRVTLTNGNEFEVDANWIHNMGMSNWKNWKCEAGVTRIVIEDDLTVYSGECNNDALGNLKTGWDILSSPTTCTRDRCTGCTDDLLINKEEHEH